jgi:hypothetical protein
MFKIKHTALKKCTDANQTLALVDAFTNVKTGRSVYKIIETAFKGITITAIAWRTHKFTNTTTCLFMIGNHHYIAIPEKTYIEYALHFADLAYKESNVCPSENILFWEYNYINNNALLVANQILNVYGGEQNKHIKTEVLEVSMGSVKQTYPRNETIVDNFACLKVKLIN